MKTKNISRHRAEPEQGHYARLLTDVVELVNITLDKPFPNGRMK